MLFEMVYEQKQGMWCSTSPVSPIHSIKPHRSTLCTYGAYQFGAALFHGKGAERSAGGKVQRACWKYRAISFIRADWATWKGQRRSQCPQPTQASAWTDRVR